MKMKRALLYRVFTKDLTIREVSETLDIPLGTAKVVPGPCFKKLRNNLKGDGEINK